MLTRGLICLGVTLGISSVASAQPAGAGAAPPGTATVVEPGEPTPGTAAAAAAAAADAKDAAGEKGAAAGAKAEKPRTGDIITLKNGRILSGGQVTRETASRVEVQLLEGDPPLAILKKQIESIERDDIEPGKPNRNRASASPAENAEVIINASQIPSELNQKLTQPLPDTILTGINGQDYVIALQQISAETGVPIQIDPALSALPAEQRTWNSTPATGTTLFTLLLDDLRKSFPDIAIAYEADGLHIRPRAVNPGAPGAAGTPPPIGTPPAGIVPPAPPVGTAPPPLPLQFGS